MDTKIRPYAGVIDYATGEVIGFVETFTGAAYRCFVGADLPCGKIINTGHFRSRRDASSEYDAHCRILEPVKPHKIARLKREFRTYAAAHGFYAPSFRRGHWYRVHED